MEIRSRTAAKSISGISQAQPFLPGHLVIFFAEFSLALSVFADGIRRAV